jgi:transcriptional regulator with XRE-family HTH domain
MCPTERSTSPRPPRKGRPTLEIWRFRTWYREELEKQPGLSLRQIAKRIGYEHNASRLSEYLKGKRVPGAAMVRQMAEAIGASPVAALWLAGYHETFFEELQSLYRLGWMWCREDGADLREDGATWPITVGPNGDYVYIPAAIAHRYHRAVIYQTSEGSHPIAGTVVLPWPLLLAVFMAIGAFPRRGDMVKPGHVERIARLAALAGPYVRAAKKLRMPENFKPLDVLRSAKSISQLRYLQLSGAAIVAEYANLWADLVCRKYAAYARLALFESIGQMDLLRHDHGNWLEAGKAAEFPTEEELDALAKAVT